MSPSRLLLSVPCASHVRHVPLAAAGSEAPSEPGLSPGSGAASAPSTRVARREGETVDSTRVVRWEVGGIFTGSPHAPPRLTLTGVCTTYTSSPAPQSRGPVADVSKVSWFTAAGSRPHAEGVEHCLTRAPHPDPCRSDFWGPRFLRPPFGRTHIPTNRGPPESFLLLGRCTRELRVILRRLWTCQPRGEEQPPAHATASTSIRLLTECMLSPTFATKDQASPTALACV